MRIKWYYFLKMTFHVICEFFGKNQKILKSGEIRDYNEETESLEEKTFSFNKEFLPNWEVAKYTGGSRPSCFG